jgi:hypothetical protein
VTFQFPLSFLRIPNPFHVGTSVLQLNKIGSIFLEDPIISHPDTRVKHGSI